MKMSATKIHFLTDPRLSLKAKGAMFVILSMPEGEEIGVKSVMKHSKDGKYAAMKAMQELMNLGYLSRERERNKHQFAGWDYQVREEIDATEDVLPNEV